MADEKNDKKEAQKYKGNIFPTDPDFDIDDTDHAFPDGSYDRGPDFLYAIVLEEQDLIETCGDNREQADECWAKGWHIDYCFINRSNFESYRNRYQKAFPTRYRIADFTFTKSLRRVLNKNRDLQTVVRPLRITPQKEFLYELYNYNRHGKMPKTPLTETYKYISGHPSQLKEICVFKKDKLVACSIFEVGKRALFSNSGFWDLAESSRCLGTLTLLLEIEYARRSGLQYYYLGPYHKENPRYQYKTRFGGLELYDWDNERWVDFKDASVEQMLKQKLPRHKD